MVQTCMKREVKYDGKEGMQCAMRQNEGGKCVKD